MKTFIKMPTGGPHIGLFDGALEFGWNTPQHSQPLYYQPLIARHYSYRQIGQRETRRDIIEVVNIRVEVMPTCPGDWPHKKHEFAFCQSAFASVSPQHGGADVRHQNFVEHLVDGVVVHRFAYGHSGMDLYGSVVCFQRKDSRHKIQIDCQGYAAAGMLREDTFCCGGKLIHDREFVDYSTLELAHCDQCLRKWEIVDGLSFRSSARVDHAHSC